MDIYHEIHFAGTTSRFLKNGENRTFNWTITVAQHENTDSHALDGEIRKTFISWQHIQIKNQKPTILRHIITKSEFVGFWDI